MSEIFTNQDMLMVQSLLVDQRWSLEVLLPMENRKYKKYCNEINWLIYSSVQTEIWEIETLGNRIVAPTLPDNRYREVGLFLVDIGYCKKNWSIK